MACLSDIVSRLKVQLGTEVAGDYDGEMKIDYIQLRTKRSRGGKPGQNKGIVYIGVWKLTETPPEGCCAIVYGSGPMEAAQNGVLPKNVLCLSGAFDVLDVYETVQGRAAFVCSV